MIYFYINKPNDRLVIHNSDCAYVGMHNTPNQRRYEVSKEEDILKFLIKVKREIFNNQEGTRDMWIKINLDNEESNIELVSKIQKVLNDDRLSNTTEIHRCNACYQNNPAEF